MYGTKSTSNTLLDSKNSSNSNNTRNLNSKPPVLLPRPHCLPKDKPKPVQTTNENKSGGKVDDNSIKSKDSEDKKHKGISRMGSIEHMTPKVWLQGKVLHSYPVKDIPPRFDLPLPNDLPKRRFCDIWKSVPVPCVKINTPPPSEENERLTDLSEIIADVTANEEPLKVEISHIEASPSSQLHNHVDTSLITRLNVKNDTKLHHRQFFKRDPKSPGVNTLRKMFEVKDISHQSQTSVTKSKTLGLNHTGPAIERKKPRSSTGPFLWGTWYHVNSPLNQQNHCDNNHIDNCELDGSKRRTSVDIISPKPFLSLSIAEETPCVTGLHEEIDSDVFNNDIISDNNYKQNEPIACDNSSDHKLELDPKEEPVNHNNNHQSEFKMNDNNNNEHHVKEKTVEVYQSEEECTEIMPKPAMIHSEISRENNGENEFAISGKDNCYQDQIRQDTPFISDVCKSVSSEEEISTIDEKLPHLPLCDDAEKEFSAAAQLSQTCIPSKSFLYASNSQAPEYWHSYKDLSCDTEEEVDYSSAVPPPLQATTTNNKREYHEIDPNVPPPPVRDAPKLPSTVRHQHHKNESESPSLPLDNRMRRRSSLYSTEKQFTVAGKLQDCNVTSHSTGEKRLNCIDVEVTSKNLLKSNTSSSTVLPKLNYSDIVLAESVDMQGSESSCTSEEGNSSSRNNKNQKNVKKKLQSMLPFTSKGNSANASKTTNKLKSAESTTDFDKQKIKKRLSNNFPRRKKKYETAIKSKMNPASDGAIHCNLESDSGLDIDGASVTTSSETSRSTSVVVTSTSSNSSGDGEVIKTSQTHSPSDDVHDSNTSRALPPIPTQLHATYDAPLPPIPVPRTKKSSMYSASSFVDNSSTFVAYPVGLSNPQPLYYSTSPRNVPQLTHNDSNPVRGRGDGTSVRRVPSEPPPVPHHRKVNRPVTPPRNTYGTVQNIPAPSEGNSNRSVFVPLPVMASDISKLQKQSLPGLPRRSLPADFAPSTAEQSYSDQASDKLGFNHPQAYTETVDGMQNNDATYEELHFHSAADDIPPPLPERDDVPDDFDPNQLVPPSPFLKEADKSKLLESEPLYQIYRNRTLSHASKKMLSKQQTKLKGKGSNGERSENDWKSEFMSEDLGTTTLWRSIPEVEQSDQLEGMSSEEIKLQQAQFEVITSQASYLRSLNILVNHFMKAKSMNSVKVLPLTDRKVLFSNVETVCNVEKRFLQDLEQHFWMDLKLSRVCDIVERYAKSEFSAYILYTQNQMYQDRVLKKLQDNHESFMEELRRLESSTACNKLPLFSFLLLPMQRVTRLPLLVTAIVNAADAIGDSETCQKAKQTLREVNRLVKKCDEGARKMQQTEELAEIASQLDYSSSVKTYALISQSRCLVKKGEMNVTMTTDSKKAAKSSKVWLFLFTDVLLIAKKKSFSIDLGGSSPRFEVIDWANRQFLTVNESAMTDSSIFLVVLENQAGKRVEMALMPSSQNELSRWTVALNPPSLGDAGESIYETWDCPQYLCVSPYTAEQPDELSIDVGDIMQVLKKTSDGWFEGERLRDGEGGWFPGSFCEEIKDEHVRARNMRNLHKTWCS